MKRNKPAILVTGASGFIGRHFVKTVSKKFMLFCIARRSQKEAGITDSANICWIQADITNWKNLVSVAEYIEQKGGIDYVLHLAGYYDFSMDDNPAYTDTNITGTRNLLNMSQVLKTKRFIFASSLAACKFPGEGSSLTEKSKADADFPYAKSKGEGEKIIHEYAGSFPCTIVRLAAVYSDWCENPPLYMLLKKWLTGGGLISRAIAGKGASAMPYIHVKDLIELFLRIIEKSDSLPDYSILIASPKGSVSHTDLFATSTQYFHKSEVTPVYIPKSIAAIFLVLRTFTGKLVGMESFELPWMSRYIDKKLVADPSKTYHALCWEPAASYHIINRLPLMIENMKAHPDIWAFRNESLLKRFAVRVSIQIYDIITENRDLIVGNIVDQINSPQHASQYLHYLQMDQDLLRWNIILKCQMMAVAVRSRDQTIIQNYVQILSTRRHMEGFSSGEVKRCMRFVGKTIKEHLLRVPALKKQKHRVDDYIIGTVEFAVDVIEQTYEEHESQTPDYVTEIKKGEFLASIDTIKPIVRQLENVCQSLVDL